MFISCFSGPQLSLGSTGLPINNKCVVHSSGREPEAYAPSLLWCGMCASGFLPLFIAFDLCRKRLLSWGQGQMIAFCLSFFKTRDRQFISSQDIPPVFNDFESCPVAAEVV